MPKENLPSPSQKEPPQANGFKEAFESIRTIFVAAIALLISIVQWLIHWFTDWQERTEVQSKLLNKQREEEQAQIAYKKRAEERELREEERKAKEKAKIEEEQRAEERSIREEARRKKEKVSLNKIVYPALSAISTLALIIGVTRLAPIAKWTRNQNECIQQTTSDGNQLDQLNLANKVMRCNGGHD